LGAVIERASGQSYESYLESEILRPAGMAHSTFDPGIMFRFPEVTTLYSPRRTGARPRLVPSQDWWEDTSLRACGGLRTNVDDMLAYLEIYRTGGRVHREQIIAASSLRKMLRPGIEIRPGSYYGYGIEVLPDYHGNFVAGHAGGLKGVSSEFLVIPRKGIGGVVLANVENAPSAVALRAGINQLLGLPIRTPLRAIPSATAIPRSLREYEGWYCSGEGIWAKIRAVRRHLRLDFHGIEATMKGLRLKPNGNDSFVLRVQGQSGLIQFKRDERGQLWAAFLGWRLIRRRNPRELARARTSRMVW
ncbi:MAG: serine hydrolase, partial [Thermoplasmata archaeon]